LTELTRQEDRAEERYKALVLVVRRHKPLFKHDTDQIGSTTITRLDEEIHTGWGICITISICLIEMKRQRTVEEEHNLSVDDDGVA
jgi:hypothetical protein